MSEEKLETIHKPEREGHLLWSCIAMMGFYGGFGLVFIVIVPKFTKMFAEMEVPLPVLSSFLVSTHPAFFFAFYALVAISFGVIEAKVRSISTRRIIYITALILLGVQVVMLVVILFMPLVGDVTSIETAP